MMSHSHLTRWRTLARKRSRQGSSPAPADPSGVRKLSVSARAPTQHARVRAPPLPVQQEHRTSMPVVSRQSTADRRTRSRLVEFASKGSLAVMDQALFSGANFLASIALARSLTPADYGAYSVAF